MKRICIHYNISKKPYTYTHAYMHTYIRYIHTYIPMQAHVLKKYTADKATTFLMDLAEHVMNTGKKK